MSDKDVQNLNNQHNDNGEAGNGGEAKGQETNTGNEGKKEEYIPKASYEVVRNKYLEAKKKLDEIQKQIEAEKQKQLEEQGKYKELAEKREQELQQIKERYINDKKATALQVEALKMGAIDPEAVIKLADLSKVEVSEEGTVDQASLKAVLGELKETKSYLFGKTGNANIGKPGGNPQGGKPTETPTFKRSQLRDPKFYAEHETEILQAMKEGKIVDDLSSE